MYFKLKKVNYKMSRMFYPTELYLPRDDCYGGSDGGSGGGSVTVAIF